MLFRSPSGIAVATLSVCTQTSFSTSGGEERSEVEWHKVTVWGRQAEACNQHLTKGARVEISGSIHYTQWEDRETGEKRYGVEIRAQRVLFLDRPKREAFPAEELPSDLAGQPGLESEPEPVVEEPKKRRRKAAA